MRRAGVVGTALFTLLQLGCPTFTNDSYLYREGFQSCPSGCGWQRIAGSSSDVSIVETLPGERGLELRGVAAVRHSLMDNPIPASSFVTASSFALDLIGRCDVNSALQVQITATTEDGSPVVYEPLADTPSHWNRPRPALEIFPSVDFPEPVLVSLGDIVITKIGDGVCEIDEVGIFFEDPFRFER